ncbi:MAG: LysM peptidoglycan-binding domain-containing protein [Chloroflexi bacterium]|nr:LysM peptidoglycan-binding domain-containing protein [Chloroflexota bacterium]
MKPRLILSLLMCAMLLAACYRQAEEPFQQIDSAEVVVEATVTQALAADESGGNAAGVEGSDFNTTPGEYITPETAPGQVEQPTLALQTTEAAEPAPTLAPFVRPTATLSFEEQLDPDDECVYAVQAGNVLFRLALAWGTTYQTIMEVNQLDTEDLAIGQLLLIPDCQSTEPEVSIPELPATVGAIEIADDEKVTATEPVDSSAEATAEEQATPEPTSTPAPTATPRPEIHVVSAGETIESISLLYRVDVNELIALNELTNPNQVSVGQELKLPPG